MKIICGSRHAGLRQGMNDQCYKQFKRAVLSKIQGGKILFIYEGANVGLVDSQNVHYKHLVRIMHPYLFQFCQKEKVDLAFPDPRFTSSLYSEHDWAVRSQKLILELGSIIEITSPRPNTFSKLEKMISANEFTWKFKEVPGENMLAFKKELSVLYCSTDAAFLREVKERQDQYDHIVLIVGLAHFLHIKTAFPDESLQFVNLVDPNTTTLEDMALAYAAYYG